MIQPGNGQTFLDVAIQETGSLEAAFEMALLNDVSITDDLLITDQLEAPEPMDLEIVSYYVRNDIKPATEIKLVPVEDGLYVLDGYWEIDYTL